MPGGMSRRRPRGHDVCPHAVHIEGGTYPGNGGQFSIIQAYRRQQRSGSDNPDAQRLFVGCVCGDEGSRVAIECHTATDYLCSLLRIARGSDLDCQPEAVEQLWSELTFLRVHRSDQDQPGGVGDGDSVAFDSRTAHRRSI